tara:strand:- start:611 stop:1330 length:720 start_codon:yes stop_codon:yes gene_type:complete
MAYGKLKADTLVYDNSGSDVEITISGIPTSTSLNAYALLAGATFTGNVNFDGDVVIKGDATNGSGELTLNCENNSHGIKLKGPPHSAAASYTLTFPNDTGSASQFLTTNGSGVLSWSSPSGGVSLSVANTWTAGQRAEITTLTDGATITPNLADSNNYVVTLAGNRTIANPTNIVAGQSGSIFILQDGTGSRTATWGSYWDFAGGTPPTLSTAASAVDRIDYIVRSSTSIQTVATLAYS